MGNGEEMSVQIKLTAIADAIRAKTGTTARLSLDEMADMILTIEGGYIEVSQFAPILSIDGDIVTITPEDSFRFYDTNYGVLSVPKINDYQYDLSQAQYNTTGDYEGEWVALPNGEHTIYATACRFTGAEWTDADIVEPAIETVASNTVNYKISADVETYSFTKNIAIGETIMIFAESHSSGMETPEITDFKVISNNGVVEIEQNPEYFNVTGLKAGTATIKCTTTNYDETFNVCTAISTYTITVTGGSSGGDTGDTISFNLNLYDVDGATYEDTITLQANSGMTFRQWADSDYTNDSTIIDDGYANDEYPEGWVMYNHDENGDTYWVLVQPSDVIANGATYKADRY